MPNCRVGPSHVPDPVEVRKLAWFLASDGTAWLSRKTPTQGDHGDDEQTRSARRPGEEPVTEPPGRRAVPAVRRRGLPGEVTVAHAGRPVVALRSTSQPSSVVVVADRKPSAPLPCPCARERRSVAVGGSADRGDGRRDLGLQVSPAAARSRGQAACSGTRCRRRSVRKDFSSAVLSAARPLEQTIS